ncbi:MAG: hypothetical protein QOI07_921 [Verrucomicrobiota bacterium]|jgi:hypothetical protein
MAQPATIIDAPSGETQKHGSQQVVLSVAGTLTAEEISFRKAMRGLQSTDEVGKPFKAAYVAGWGEGSMTLQIKSTTTIVTLGETGAFLRTNGTTVMPFIITEVGDEYRQNDITKIPVKITEKIN